MKTKNFLLLGICCFALTACGGDDKSGAENGEIPKDAKVTFTRMANCPISMGDFRQTKYNGLIYYLSDKGEIITYNPNKNEWQTLQSVHIANLYSSGIFVWENKLHYHSRSDIYIYSENSDSWTLTDKISTISFGGSSISNLCGKLFTIRYNNYDGHTDIFQWYDFVSKTWKSVDNSSYISPSRNSICCMDDIIYFISGGSIYQLNPQTINYTQKLFITTRITHPYLCVYGTSILFCCHYDTQYHSPNDYTFYLYSPTTNECNQIAFLQAHDSPITINRLTSIDSRIFAGPNNAAFYELKFK